jgi:hypothetical protein
VGSLFDARLRHAALEVEAPALQLVMPPRRFVAHQQPALGGPHRLCLLLLCRLRRRRLLRCRRRCIHAAHTPHTTATTTTAALLALHTLRQHTWRVGAQASLTSVHQPGVGAVCPRATLRLSLALMERRVASRRMLLLVQIVMAPPGRIRGWFEGKGVSTSRVRPPGPLSISYGHVGCLKARAFPPPVCAHQVHTLMQARPTDGWHEVQPSPLKSISV